MESEMPSEIEMISRLKDKELLRNYCHFAGIHRARVADSLFRSLGGAEENERRSIGLELLGNLVATLEDAALWFFVLKEWKKGKTLLFDLLDTTKIIESAEHPKSERAGHAKSSEAALSEMAKWTIADLRREFGLPRDEDLLKQGWTEPMLNQHINGLRAVLHVFKDALELRTEEQRAMVNSYNKIKHGALAIATTEHSSINVSVMLPSRRGSVDPISRKRKINFAWIPCEDEALRSLVGMTIQTSRALWLILNVLYRVRFDPDWESPAWPYNISKD